MFTRILDLLFPPRTDEAVVRGLTSDSFLALLSPTAISHAATLLPFHHPQVRAVIHEAKYHGNARAFRLLTAVLVEYLRENEYTPTTCVLVPVPLGTKRRSERGYNQTEEVARRAGKELSVPVLTDVLVRTRETPTQISLPREKRIENVRGAFAATRTIDPRLTYLLVDDVMTTGATLEAAANALAAGGAVHILPIALAH